MQSHAVRHCNGLNHGYKYSVLRVCESDSEKSHVFFMLRAWECFHINPLLAELFQINVDRYSHLALLILTLQWNGACSWNSTLWRARTGMSYIQIPCLQMTWQCKEPTHRQLWYWHSLYRKLHCFMKRCDHDDFYSSKSKGDQKSISLFGL